MSKFTKAEQLFLQLYRHALWADVPGREPSFVDAADEATWQRVADVAEAQTCTGLLADALAQLPADRRPPKPIYFSVVTATADAEDANRKMNHYLCGLFPMLARHGIRAWLLKGQGLARCYPQPLHRMPGDIDVLIPREEEFQRAVRLFAGHLPADEPTSSHERLFHLDDVLIELHGKIVTDLNPLPCVEPSLLRATARCVGRCGLAPHGFRCRLRVSSPCAPLCGRRRWLATGGRLDAFPLCSPSPGWRAAH